MLVWLISAFEPIPSDGSRPMRYMGIADSLRAKGHRVVFWTSTFHHGSKSHRFEADHIADVDEGYKVIALRSMGYSKNISPRRFLAHLHFARRLAQRMPEFEKPDVILISLPPIDTVSAAISYGIKHNVPVAVDIIDPWPDVFLSVLPQKLRQPFKPIFAPIYLQCASIFLRASGICAISKMYLDWAQKLGGRRARHKEVFYPGADIKRFDAQIKRIGGYQRNDGSGETRFVYAGALASSYDVETVIEAAARLSQEGVTRARFLIAGSGPKEQALRRMAAGLDNVEIVGWLGADQLAELYARSHVGLICHAKGATQSVTYKIFDYLAASMPVLCSLPGEMAEIIERQKVGYFYRPEDADELARLVKKICDAPGEIEKMGVRARKYAVKEGDSAKVYERMAAFLEKVAGQKSN